MQLSDCNFDPTPAEMLLFTTEKHRFKAFIQPGAGITLDIPNAQLSLDSIDTD